MIMAEKIDIARDTAITVFDYIDGVVEASSLKANYRAEIMEEILIAWARHVVCVSRRITKRKEKLNVDNGWVVSGRSWWEFTARN